jgi:GAF domain-containing protein
MAMTPAPLPPDEADRLRALQRYGVLDTPAEEAFDELVHLAASICGVPTALVSLVDAERQWFKARFGFQPHSTPRDVSFCAHAILRADVLVVEDAHADVRFEDNPLVTRAPFIRFYAGAPLVTRDGFRIGTLCVIDSRPRTLGREQGLALRTLAHQVLAQLELRRLAHESTRVAQTIQHELRTPLTAILGCLALLASGTVGGLNAEAREAVAVVERNTERLKTFIEELEGA